MLNFLERPELSREYRSSFKRIAKEAILGTENAYKINNDRIKFLKNNKDFFCRNHLPTYILKGHCIENLEYDLQKINGRISPMLKIPKILKKSLPENASILLQSCLSKTNFKSQVDSIFRVANFIPNDFRYRTEDILQITGHNGLDIRSLSGIAHELGHCLFELNFHQLELFSEVFAMCFESYMVEKFLENEEEIAEWRSYQSNIDRLNISLHILETSKDIAIPKFDPALLLLRETLFTKPGYQFVYAKSSLMRQKIFAKIDSRRPYATN